MIVVTLVIHEELLISSLYLQFSCFFSFFNACISFFFHRLDVTKLLPSVNCAVSVACNIVVLANECINVQKL